jgi:hypothetical protein
MTATGPQAREELANGENRTLRKPAHAGRLAGAGVMSLWSTPPAPAIAAATAVHRFPSGCEKSCELLQVVTLTAPDHEPE